MRKDIVITVEGGVIQEIYNIPRDTKVIVVDYDVDGISEEDLVVSPYDSAHKCVLSCWKNNL